VNETKSLKDVSPQLNRLKHSTGQAKTRKRESIRLRPFDKLKARAGQAKIEDIFYDFWPEDVNPEKIGIKWGVKTPIRGFSHRAWRRAQSEPLIFTNFH
jgi:hypothetical protein